MQVKTLPITNRDGSFKSFIVVDAELSVGGFFTVWFLSVFSGKERLQITFRIIYVSPGDRELFDSYTSFCAQRFTFYSFPTGILLWANIGAPILFASQIAFSQRL
ncbi:MAG: hypothetical protein RBR87_00780 [Bacteroidales bacterium]|jgi:hypothetical protein|nr:hypothetical protein [Bacteroidales bacterium]